MLDIVTLRVTFTLIAASMLVLFYVGTYRSTRAAFCGWWCVSLAAFMGASFLWLFNGTAAQVWANPLGNVVGVAGAAAAWTGARSLHRSGPSWPVLAAGPALAGLASALGDPRDDVWSGGAAFLALMALGLGLAARELWLVRHTTQESPERNASVAALLCYACGAVAVFYLGRMLAFVTAGPDSEVFRTWFGSTPTTLLISVMLVAVSFSMSSLSHRQFIQDLHRRATRDDLTGALQRREFLALAAQAVRQVDHSVLIMADLDHFKRVNDTFGHATGDEVLASFARACRDACRSGDLVARFGGEEFVLLLPGARVEAADVVTHAIARLLQAADPLQGRGEVTASFGSAVVDDGTDLTQALRHADEALYRAKAEGRNRAVHYVRA
ncbi:MAG TPA: GGDEF domain-containing protein [Nocardioides sp.]|uniref:GGDEF domain-containing protein n=1 Tax=Nocardioides sp. TaxID=35761 RepID=UPI002ED9E4EC